MAIQALLVILAVLLVLLFLGVPISYAIAVSSLTAILSSIDLNVAVLTAAQRTFVGMSKFSLTAIPFFILAGNIMNQGGIAKRLVDFVMSILGKLPGALLITNIGTNALFGAISGSASAAAAAVGSVCSGNFNAVEPRGSSFSAGLGTGHRNRRGGTGSRRRTGNPKTGGGESGRIAGGDAVAARHCRCTGRSGDVYLRGQLHRDRTSHSVLHGSCCRRTAADRLSGKRGEDTCGNSFLNSCGRN